jgi:hypothetical protein
MPRSQSSPATSHSLDTERRLTTAEKDLEHVQYRMSLHEKAILFLFGLVYVLFQDKFPELAKAIRGAIP